MRTRCVLLGFAASVLLAVAPSAGGANRTAVWLPTTTLAGPNSYGAGMALNARGDAVVTWTNGPDLIARFRGATTSDWGTALTVDHNVSGTPVAAIDDHGSAIVAWAAPTGVIFVSTRPLRADAWTRPLALSGAGSIVDNPQIAIDAAGDVTVGWLEYAEDAHHFRAAYRPAGGTWSTTEVVSTPRMLVPGSSPGGPTRRSISACSTRRDPIRRPLDCG